LQEGIAAPIRHLIGVLEGLRAGIRLATQQTALPQRLSIVRKVGQDPF
jgi:hypothetical protein